MPCNGLPGKLPSNVRGHRHLRHLAVNVVPCGIKWQPLKRARVFQDVEHAGALGKRGEHRTQWWWRSRGSGVGCSDASQRLWASQMHRKLGLSSWAAACMQSSNHVNSKVGRVRMIAGSQMKREKNVHATRAIPMQALRRETGEGKWSCPFGGSCHPRSSKGPCASNDGSSRCLVK